MDKDFKTLLENLANDGVTIQVALAHFGVIPAKVKSIREDIATIEGKILGSTGRVMKQVFYMHYTAVVIVT